MCRSFFAAVVQLIPALIYGFVTQIGKPRAIDFGFYNLPPWYQGILVLQLLLLKNFLDIYGHDHVISNPPCRFPSKTRPSFVIPVFNYVNHFFKIYTELWLTRKKDMNS